MFVATVVLAVLVAALFAMAGGAKLAGHPAMVEARGHLGIADVLWKMIGALELLGAVGVLVGLSGSLAVIGVLAGVGLVGMTIGAVFYHQKAGDAIRDWLPAVVAGSLVIFYVIARIGSL